MASGWKYLTDIQSVNVNIDSTQQKSLNKRAHLFQNFFFLIVKQYIQLDVVWHVPTISMVEIAIHTCPNEITCFAVEIH